MKTVSNDDLESFLSPKITGSKKKSNNISSTLYCKSNSFEFSINITSEQVTVSYYHQINHPFIVARYELKSQKESFPNEQNNESNKARQVFSYIVRFVKGEIKALPKEFKL
ncbi:Uncharacterised protein [Candidatus Tiddalikarchaeum anstoanum]|nr:Uncharacterised protein [Candidatus Tiddalikarchaeum anstoanum]